MRCVRKKMRKRRGGFADTMRCVEIELERSEGGEISEDCFGVFRSLAVFDAAVVALLRV